MKVLVLNYCKRTKFVVHEPSSSQDITEHWYDNNFVEKDDVRLIYKIKYTEELKPAIIDP